MVPKCHSKLTHFHSLTGYSQRDVGLQAVYLTNSQFQFCELQVCGCLNGPKVLHRPLSQNISDFLVLALHVIELCDLTNSRMIVGIPKLLFFIS